jgi:hypothetical protein
LQSAQPDRFTQPALDKIPLHRAAQRLSHCETDTRIASARFTLPPEIKHRYVRREVPLALLVHPLEIRVLE